ncbi:L-PSP (mRNA) endoribonuclease [uncultured delta proteobacterium]|uniref:L-PSP (mRNA) endoribonuclease n=1 Tax=uncultured delta proteobacterium TaxID=34034 RepID=A0A212KEG6_9DELT|nr:L-PSP (mRNA) endoribonuclease [uncultured delta proteobacterium]
MKREIVTGAAKLGPYSVAVENNGVLYISGQLGVTQSGEFAGPSSAEQARQSMENLKSILTAAGYTLDEVLKSLIFVTDLADFTAVNEVYASFFSGTYPARSCVQVAALPKGAKVEIEMIAAH